MTWDDITRADGNLLSAEALVARVATKSYAAAEDVAEFLAKTLVGWSRNTPAIDGGPFSCTHEKDLFGCHEQVHKYTEIMDMPEPEGEVEKMLRSSEAYNLVLSRLMAAAHSR